MTRRVRYLIDTPNATLGGDSYRPGRKGDMGAEAWVPETELTRLREALEDIASAQRYPSHGDPVILRDRARAALAVLPPPPGGDDEGEGAG